ncbi:MAG: hypothetical protein V8S58_18035 [Lachnospiraceae bacterium]
MITKGLYAEQQVQSGASGAYGDPAFQELFFQVSSEKAADLTGIFRNTGRKPTLSAGYAGENRTGAVGTGRFTESVETDLFGRPVYAVTEFQGQYPRYDADGTLLTREHPVSRSVTDARVWQKKNWTLPAVKH